MPDSTEPKYIDKRTADRYLREGSLDEKVYERHLKALPDIADKAITVETSMADTDEEQPPSARKPIV